LSRQQTARLILNQQPRLHEKLQFLVKYFIESLFFFFHNTIDYFFNESLLGIVKSESAQKLHPCPSRFFLFEFLRDLNCLQRQHSSTIHLVFCNFARYIYLRLKLCADVALNDDILTAISTAASGAAHNTRVLFQPPGESKWLPQLLSGLCQALSIIHQQLLGLEHRFLLLSFDPPLCLVPNQDRNIRIPQINHSRHLNRGKILNTGLCNPSRELPEPSTRYSRRMSIFLSLIVM